jgi:hypothetical protein
MIGKKVHHLAAAASGGMSATFTSGFNHLAGRRQAFAEAAKSSV